MKFGIMFANAGMFGEPDNAAELAVAAEDAGFESLWTVEHVVIPKEYGSIYPYNAKGRLPGGVSASVPDPIVWMSFAAALTKKIRFSTGILILPQRHPLYVAKEFATLDQLSKGRAMMGVGIGWLEEEFNALDVPFKKRVARTEESIEAIRSLWNNDIASFEGSQFSWDEVGSNPKPVQEGGVPIIIGGHVDAAARRAARFGDGFFPGRIDRLDELLAELRAECEKIGRDPESVEITTGTPDMSIDNIKAMADKGISRLTISLPVRAKDDIRRGVETFAENVIRHFD